MIKFTGRPKLTDTIAAVVRADDLILDLIDKNRAVRETCQSLMAFAKVSSVLIAKMRKLVISNFNGIC